MTDYPPPTPAQVRTVLRRLALWEKHRPQKIAEDLRLPVRVVYRIKRGITYSGREKK